MDSKYRLFKKGQTVVDLVQNSPHPRSSPPSRPLLYPPKPPTPTTNTDPQGFAPGSWSQVALDRTRPSGRVLGIDLLPAQPPRGVSAIQGNFLSPAVRDLVKTFLLDANRRAKAARPQQPPDEDAEVGEDRVVAEARPSYLAADKLEALTPEAEVKGDERLVDVSLEPKSLTARQACSFSLIC
jgi:21S rRNA (uridine2791-2'-O)-methyltransferase